MAKLDARDRAETVVLATRVPSILGRAIHDLARLHDRPIAGEIRVALREHALAAGRNPGPEAGDE